MRLDAKTAHANRLSFENVLRGDTLL
uniref:Uncharacterized protein n=1 Tax=Ralstonia solanacearum TaxID=305 RepID=A0A0S4TMX2_RALSL|nr:protein of unknown function [Ralstonia solanacearum]